MSISNIKYPISQFQSFKKALYPLIFFALLITPALSSAALDFTPPSFRDANYQGKYVSQSIPDPIVIPAGASREVIVKIKNVGKAIWLNSGKNFVSAYTVDPHYRASAFSGQGWLSKSQPAKISKTAKPGQTAEIKIKLYAPTKLGDYTEKFYLAAENKTWIKGGYFYLKIKVAKNAAANKNAPAGNGQNGSSETERNIDDAATEINQEYRADLIAFSARRVESNGGDLVRFVVRYVNGGALTWNDYLWQEAGSRWNSAVAPAPSTTEKISIADQSWLNVSKIVRGSQTTAPGQPLEIIYYFRLPAKRGEYIARFQLAANGHTLDGGTLELPVTVLADAPDDYRQPIFVASRQLVPEPNIRVGLYKVEKPVQFSAPFVYQIFSGKILKGFLPAHEAAELTYTDGLYGFQSQSFAFYAREPIRLVPNNPGDYFVLTNYERKVSWKGTTNFNAYRGTMEFKYSPKSDAPFVINELLLDAYIAGIGETSNGAAMEYIKALLTAARSYGYYHIYNGVPAEQRTFDVVATTADQLYLGYNSELLLPRVTQAATATYGEMVTYNSEVATTPYFGNSDGRTRTWSQAWGGADKPYLQSVECLYDQGRRLLGHGVGLSMRDAATRADKDGWTYDQLLKYYYTGVEVEKIY